MSGTAKEELRKQYPSGIMLTLDKGYTNESTVTVVSQTYDLLYTKVKDDEGNEWEVRTYRLSEIWE
jgi:hypothetical protein